MSSIVIPTARPTHTARSSAAVPAPPAPFLRRRLVALAVLVLVAFLLTVAIGRIGASASLEDRVAGHVVVEPGETLWHVAAATAPDGVDTRQQLADLRELNGIEGSHIDAWTVVLVPAR